jgi:hypothetical protein
LREKYGKVNSARGLIVSMFPSDAILRSLDFVVGSVIGSGEAEVAEGVESSKVGKVAGVTIEQVFSESVGAFSRGTAQGGV